MIRTGNQGDVVILVLNNRTVRSRAEERHRHVRGQEASRRKPEVLGRIGKLLPIGWKSSHQKQHGRLKKLWNSIVGYFCNSSSVAEQMNFAKDLLAEITPTFLLVPGGKKCTKLPKLLVHNHHNHA